MSLNTKFSSEIFYDRLLYFSLSCLKLVKKLPKTLYNNEYGKQLISSSASPGANYIEAIEASSRKEFIYKLKACRKETKESIHWLVLIQRANEEMNETSKDSENAIIEAKEFIRIFTSSILTAEKNGAIKKISK
jgi:four helix bundle protein